MNQKTPQYLHVYIAAALWLLGFLCSFTPLDAYEGQSVLGTVLACGFSGFFALGGARDFRLGAALRSPLILCAIGFWLVTLLGALFSEVRFVSYIYFCVFSLFPLSFFLAAYSFERAFAFMAAPLALIATVVAGYALIQYLLPTDILAFEHVYDPLSNPNALAAILSLAVFAGLGTMIGAQSRWPSNLALIFTLLCVLALLTTGSREAFFVVIALLPVFLFLSRRAARRHVRCLGILAVLSAAAFWSFGMVGHGGFMKSPVTLMQKMSEPDNKGLPDRPEIWASTLNIIQDYPVLGTGVGTFFLYYPQYRGDDFDTAGLMAQSDPLQFAAESGIAAALLFYLFIIFAILKTFKAWPLADDTARVKIAASFCAMAAFILHAHVSFHFHVLPLLMAGGLVAGYWHVQAQSAWPEKGDAPLRGRYALLLKVLLCTLLAGFMAIFSPLYKSKTLVAEAQAEMERGAAESFADKINFADKLSYGTNAAAFLAAAEIPIGMMQFQGPMMDPAARDVLFDQAMGLLQKAEKANPRDAMIYFYRAELKSFARRIVNERGLSPPEEDLNLALTINPLHLRSRILLSDLLKRQGKKREALDVLAAGLKWPYHNQSPLFLYDKTQRLANELEDEEVLAQVQKMRNLYSLHMPDGLE